MAALIILGAIHEEEKKKKRLLQQKKNQQVRDTIILNNSMDQNLGIQYGYMWFIQYFKSGILMTNYKILKVDKNESIVIESIKSRILHCLENNICSDYLFYKVKNVDANIASYDAIIRSNYESLHIKIRDKRCKKICVFSNNRKLFKLLYDKLDFLKNYNDYMNHLENLSKKELIQIFEETFGEEPKMIFFKKFIIRNLLDNKKREFINNY